MLSIKCLFNISALLFSSPQLGQFELKLGDMVGDGKQLGLVIMGLGGDSGDAGVMEVGEIE
jgi:hypothetical protein